jgi:hypothetical protein
VVTAAGQVASPAQCFDVDGWRFLEVERFDRVGQRGRRGVLSLSALNSEYLGTPTPDCSTALLRPPFFFAGDAKQLRWLDVFGQLIGNTDRDWEMSFLPGAVSARPAWLMLDDPGARCDVAGRAFETFGAHQSTRRLATRR